MESEIKRDKTEMNISFWSWRKGEKRRTKEKRKEEEEDHRYEICVWFGFGNSQSHFLIGLSEKSSKDPRCVFLRRV